MTATELHLPGYEAKHLGKLLAAMGKNLTAQGGTRPALEGITIQAADERTLRLTAADGFVLMRADFMLSKEACSRMPHALTEVLAGADVQEHAVIPYKHAVKGAIDLAKELQATRTRETFTLGFQRLANVGDAVWIGGVTTMPFPAAAVNQLLDDARNNEGTDQCAFDSRIVERAMRALGAVGGDESTHSKVRFMSTHKSSAAYLTAVYESGYRVNAECVIMPLFVQW